MPYMKCRCGDSVYMFEDEAVPECTRCYEKRMGYDKMHQMSFKRFHDPGHSWVEVRLTLLRELEIAGLITSFSYQRGPHVYLEEDNDLSTFVLACHANNIHPQWLEEHTNNDSPIRSYLPYHLKTPSNNDGSHGKGSTMSTIKIAVYRVGQAVSIEEVNDALEVYQAIVGGYIQAVTLNPEGLTLACNEEGKLRGLPVNAVLRFAGGGADAIVGDFFLCRTEDCEFVSLRPEDIKGLPTIITSRIPSVNRED